ncbi:MAG TPA: hypothetical protein VGR07_08320 [Thermoanaerobaculia bacterium]|nr:hypothetical protein [Thermoanaerobaculia bacterium]
MLVILAVFAGFRAIAPHRAAPRVAAPAAGPQPAAEAPAAATGWGGKPLQARVRKTGAAVVVPPAAGTEPAVAGVGLTPEEVAARIRQGLPALVLFFSTESPGSEEMFPRFVKLTQSPAADRVRVLAFATDQDASAVDTFLRVHQANFEAPLLRPAKPGEWKAALAEAEIGLKIGKQLDPPLLAVVGPGGELLGQWQGIADLAPVEAALKKVPP